MTIKTESTNFETLQGGDTAIIPDNGDRLLIYLGRNRVVVEKKGNDWLITCNTNITVTQHHPSEHNQTP